MPAWQSVLVAAVAVLFGAFVIWKYRPLGVFEGASPLGPDVRRARERAREASTPRDRATALVEAGDLASASGHATAAIGYYLRAMRVEPGWVEPVRAACRGLERRRPRALETLLWRRLAQLAWDPDTGDAARAAADGLAQLYAGRLRERDRAAAMRKLAARI
jgi:hypothetical protein